MRTKDFLALEAAYQTVLEAKDSLPCPCTVGKHCKKPDCPCTRCKKDKKKMMKENDMNDMDDSVSDSGRLLERIKAVLMASVHDPEANSPESTIDHIKEILAGGGNQEDSHHTHLDNWD
jgi:hypothetical protein